MTSRFTLIGSALCLGLWISVTPPLAIAGPAELGDQLKTSSTTGQAPAELVVTYDDMHGIHGGSTIRVGADGKVSRVDVHRGQESKASGEITPLQLTGLLTLIVELEAWTQKTPERQLVPGESQARLKMAIGDDEVELWEFYNDMEANQRLSRIKAHLDELLPASAP